MQQLLEMMASQASTQQVEQAVRRKKAKGKKLGGESEVSTEAMPTPVKAAPKKRAKKRAAEDEEQQQAVDDDEEEPMVPGQKYRPPPEGDGTRIFYESLLQQRPWS